MSGNRKEKVTIQTQTLEETEGTEAEASRDMYLREGRTLSVKSEGGEDLVEIRSASGMVEVRIKLTEEGPVLQMEAARLQLKASEAVEIESKRIDIKATESAKIESGGALELAAETDIKVEADGEVRVNGKMIYLN
jgi:phage gp45-like